MRKKKCVTGCSTRTYREDILLLLNCIAENCDNPAIPEYDINSSRSCCGESYCLTKDGEEVGGCVTTHDIGRVTADNTLPTTATILPVYFDTDTQLWAEAQADSVDTLADLLVFSVTSEQFDAYSEGYYCLPYDAFFVPGEWYCLDPNNAGELVLESSLTPGTDIIQRALFVLEQTVGVNTCVYIALDTGALAEPFCIAPEENNALTQDVDGCLQVLVSEDPSNALSIVDGELFATGGSSDGWALTGNAGTVEGTNFIGTTDNVPFEGRANDERIFKAFPDTVAPLWVGGSDLNGTDNPNTSAPSALPNSGCFIGGGGGNAAVFTGAGNRIWDGYFGSIVGGISNYLEGDGLGFYTLGAPQSSGMSIIGAGVANFISSYGYDAPGPSAEPTTLYQGSNIIGSGIQNFMIGVDLCVIGGGRSNGIRAFSTYSAGGSDGIPFPGADGILSGSANEIEYADLGAFVFDPDLLYSYNIITGGNSNEIVNGYANFIGGGEVNSITLADDSSLHPYSNTIAGGTTNGTIFFQTDGTLSAHYGYNFQGGGYNSYIADGLVSGISAGWQSEIGAVGQDLYSFPQTVGESTGPWPANYIGGGVYNGIYSSGRSTIGGGGWGVIQRQDSSGVLSGYRNEILGAVSPGTGYDEEGFDFIPPTSDSGVGNVILGGVTNTINEASGSSVLGGGFLKLGSGSVGFQNPNVAAISWLPDSGPQVDVTAFINIAYFGDVDMVLGNVDDNAARLVMYEPNTDKDYSSAHYSSFEARAQAANINYILPATAGIAGQQLTIQSVVGTDVTLHWA